MFKKLLLSAFVSLALAGCAKDRTVAASPEIELTDLQTLPAPTGGYSTVVQPGDRLDIAVLGSQALTGTYYVDETGTIAFPLIGAVPARGKAPSQLARDIAAQLAGRFVLDPEVTVVPSETNVPTVSVGGQVGKPGAYPARSSQTLLRAINNAGGLSEYAKANDVLVLRTVDRQHYIGVFNVEAIQRGNYPDPTIYPDDIITVGDSPARRRLATILSVVPLISSAAILIDRLAQ
jgi:polysaccharide export outer membrane protein